MKRYFIYTIVVLFAFTSCTTSKKVEQDDDFATDSTPATAEEAVATPTQSSSEASDFDFEDKSETPAPAENAATQPPPAEKDEFADFSDQPTQSTQPPPTDIAANPPPPEKDEFAEFENQPAAAPAEQSQAPVAETTQNSQLENELNGTAPTTPPPEVAAAPAPEAPVVPPTPEVQAEVPKPEPTPEPTPEPLTQIQQVFYKPNQNGGAVTIEADHPIQFTTRLNKVTNQLVVEIQNSILPTKLKRSLNTKDMASSIGSVDIYQKSHSKVARFVVQLRQGAEEPLVQPEGNSLLIIGAANEAFIAKQKADAEKAAAAAKSAQSADGFTDLSSEGVMGTQSLEEFLVGNQKFYGKKISIETNNLDIKEAIKFIAEESGANILMDDGLTGQISLRLRQVPWDQALVLILKAKKLGYVRQGNVLRIAKLADLQTEELEAYKLLESRRNNEPMIVKKFLISYANLTDIQVKIREFIASTSAISTAKPIGGAASPTSPGTTGGAAAAGTTTGAAPTGAAPTVSPEQMGRVIADQRTGTLIVTDTPGNMEKIEKLIAALDTQPKQIVLETRIINASESFSKTIGFNWASNGATGNIGKSANGLDLGIKNGADSGGNAGILKSTFSWKNLDVIGNLDAVISLGEIQDKVKVLNTQRVTVNSGKPAQIGAQSKLRIPSTQTTINSAVGQTSSTATETITHGLKGTVIPQASNESTVSADVDILQTTLLSAKTGDTTENQLGGKVVAQSGQTIAVNASFQSTNNVNESGVPGLRDVPVLGLLFRGKSEGSSKSETLVFLTMTILDPVTGVFKKAAGEIDQGTVPATQVR